MVGWKLVIFVRMRQEIYHKTVLRASQLRRRLHLFVLISRPKKTAHRFFGLKKGYCMTYSMPFLYSSIQNITVFELS